VIEQAKGILMARHGCTPDAAFELLRRASQRANIKLSALAAALAEQAVSAPQPGAAQAPVPAFPYGRGAAPARRRQSRSA
jgi:hypothetical protein